MNLRTALLALSVLLMATAAKAQQPSVSVYEVVKTGATAAEAQALAKQLGIPAENILSAGGAIEFVDASRYLSFPTEKVPDSKLLEEALAATRNKDKSRKITPTILNAGAISELHIVPADTALSKIAAALQAAGLTPQFGKASVGHHELSLYSKDGKQNIIRENSPIDSEVTYRFTAPNGYPIYGPGAEVQLTFDATDHVSRVFYAARTLKAVGTVAVIPQERVNQEIARMFPPNSVVNSRLVYFSPPLSNPKEKSPVAILIPWYAYSVTTNVTNPKTGAVSEVKSKIGFVPATADTRFVPAVQLSAHGGTQVHAAVSVEGGRPPYQYVWGGSSPAVSQTDESSVSYTPQFRTAHPFLANPYFRLQHNETLSVTVIDATLYATASIATPVSAETVSINGNGFGVPASYAVNYNGSWGPVGPNDTLEWLLLDDCDMLDATGGSGLNVAQRWGPAFGGLHILTGFASPGYGDGPFEGGVADNVLGIHGPAQTIVQSWFNSASATGAGNAAAMGPAVEIMPNVFICDSDDYFWGKGTVGPTLVPSSYPPAIFAYWYLTSTSPLQYLF
jgi:hypothetical protein